MELRSDLYNNTSGLRDGKTYDYDVIVIGGGPAGSTVATLLSQWGHRVLLLEKERFPRHHIGESLLPGTTTVMKRLGVLDKVERTGFVNKFGATYVWGKSRDPWTIYFSEVRDESIHAFQVERAKFDKLLLDHSRENGVIVMEECRVTDVVRDGKRITGVKFLDQMQTPRTVSCRFCVDASGQNSFLGRSMKIRRFNRPLRNIALYAYFRGGRPVVDLVPDLRSQDWGNIFVVATDVGWIWYIPLGRDWFSVGFVTDAAFSREINEVGRTRFYLDSLATAPEIGFLLREARMESTSVYTQSDWSYLCRSFQGPGYLLVGDAACFIDPILSTGVDLAMEGALKAALAINTALSDPQLTVQAMNWYEEEYTTKAGNFLQMAEHWYHGHRNQREWFWKAKRLVDPGSNLSVRQAFILLTGGFTTGLPNQDLPELLPFGGFAPFQLRSIYANLDSGIPGNAQGESTTQRVNSTPTLRTSEEVHIGSVEESHPRFGGGIRYRSYMLEQDNQLVPVVQIIREVEGIPRMRVALSPTSLSLLKRIDGKRSVRDIANELTSLFGAEQEGTTNELEKMIITTVRELYKYRIVEPT